jgi:RNA polymerase sigma-70 factor (TIGR02957 family)
MTAPLEVFQEQRGRLFGIAYRMLGSASEAEDVVQDAWLRWQDVDHERVENPGAFLARTVTNLSITALTSARARREVYTGPWLPEPVLTSPHTTQPGPLDPLDTSARRESVSFALLLLMERLTPQERAVYVLREAFAYSARDVAELLDTSEANVRQLHSRARRHVGSETLNEVEPARWRTLVERFLAAALEGDVAGLEALLAADAIAYSDGGGVVKAARRPVVSADNVARLVAGLALKYADGFEPRFAQANGGPVLLGFTGGALAAAWFFEVRDDRIVSMELVLNPEKLAFADAQLSRIGGASSLSL